MLESSIVSSLSGWVKSSVGQTMASKSPYETYCIISSSLMHPARSGLMADLVGKLLLKLKYSKFPLLSPKLAKNVMSLSGSAGNLGDAY